MRVLYLIFLVIAVTVATPLVAGCHPQPATSAQASPEVAIAFAGTVAALEVLDELHAQRMRAITEPTDEQVAWATQHSERLHRLRDVLAIAREWLEGKASEADGRAAFADAASVLQLIIDELKSQGIAIPKAVDAGLAAAKYFD